MTPRFRAFFPSGGVEGGPTLAGVASHYSWLQAGWCQGTTLLFKLALAVLGRRVVESQPPPTPIDTDLASETWGERAGPGPCSLPVSPDGLGVAVSRVSEALSHRQSVSPCLWLWALSGSQL